jgi:hypothetical protein
MILENQERGETKCGNQMREKLKKIGILRSKINFGKFMNFLFLLLGENTINFLVPTLPTVTPFIVMLQEDMSPVKINVVFKITIK